jgi:Tfp pilus assembly protein PilE
MNKNLLSGGLAIIALVIGIMNYISIAELNNNIKEERKETVQTSLLEDNEEKHYELAKAMGYLQIYSHKLYLAGQNENWELSNFYAHEIEETIEEIEEAKVVDEGYDISKLVGTMTNPAFGKVEEAIDNQDKNAFADSYKLLVQSCNACHQTTQHQFVKIEIPTEGSIFNQNFSK